MIIVTIIIQFGFVSFVCGVLSLTIIASFSSCPPSLVVFAPSLPHRDGHHPKSSWMPCQGQEKGAWREDSNRPTSLISQGNGVGRSFGLVWNKNVFEGLENNAKRQNINY